MDQSTFERAMVILENIKATMSRAIEQIESARR